MSRLSRQVPHTQRRTSRLSSRHPLSLDPLDERLLRWLLRLPLQRAEDLHIALGERSAATLYRRLTRLVEAGLVEVVLPLGLGVASARLYHLSQRGLLAVAARQGDDPTRLAATWGADERSLLGLLPRACWLTRLHDVLNELLTEAPTAFAIQGRRPEVRWHWRRDVVEHIVVGEQQVRVVADAVLVMQTLHPAETPAPRERWYSLIVLLDTGIMPHRVMRTRLDSLLRYRDQRHHQGMTAFPPLLIVLSAAHRARHWQRMATETARLLGVAPLVGGLMTVPQGATLWQAPCITLASHALCHLRDLLDPLPQAALPFGGLDTPEIPRPVIRQAPAGASIRGAFALRARRRRATLDRLNQREAVGLLSLLAGEHHRVLLDLLVLAPFVSVPEIAAFLSLHPRSVERYLRDLRRLGCVEQEWLPVNAHDGLEQRLRVSARGLRLVAACHHLTLRSLADSLVDRHHEHIEVVQRGLAELRGAPQHTAGVYGFFAELACAARDTPGHRLLWWERGHAREQYYVAAASWRHHRPDGIAEYQAGEQRVRFWLEWHRDTPARDLEETYDAYQRAIASREWTREGMVLPVILIVTPDGGHEERVWRIVTQMLGTLSPRVVVQTTTSTRLAAHGPLAAIWYPLLPHALAGNADHPRRRFYELHMSRQL